MFETIVVVAVVMVVLALAGRSLYRTITGKEKGSCYGCDSCACTKPKDSGKDQLVSLS